MIPEYRVEKPTPPTWEVWTNRGGEWHAVEIGIPTEAIARVRCRRWLRKEANESRELALGLMGCSPESPEEVCIASQLQEHVKKTLERLSPLERQLITEHFGFDGKDEVEYKELSHLFGCSRSRVAQRSDRILFKIRNALKEHVVGETRRQFRLSIDPRERRKQQMARHLEELERKHQMRLPPEQRREPYCYWHWRLP